jgi:hypothetical protein
MSMKKENDREIAFKAVQSSVYFFTKKEKTDRKEEKNMH